MGRSPCCSKEELTKGAWTVMEDQILTEYIRTHGEGKWRKIPKEAGLKRCGKSCRLRWLNYLRPDIKRGNITLEEEDLIIRLHKLLGNRWSLIAGRIPGRTDNEIKNYWNTTLAKKVNNAADIHQPTNENSSCKKNKKILDEKVKNKTKTNIAVRTKALRWKNKVVVSPQVPFQVDQKHGFVSASAKSSDFDKKDQDLAKYTPELEETSSEDVMLDFDVREFLMSGISPDSDFWKICQFDGDNNNGGASKNKWPSSAAPLLFSEEVLKDWMRDDCYFHHQN